MYYQWLLAAAPDPVDSGLDPGFEALDQLLVGIDQGLFCFNFGNDGPLGFEVGNRK